MEVWKMILAALTMLAFFPYLLTMNDNMLFLVPLLSLLWWRTDRNAASLLPFFFAFHLLIALLSIFAGVIHNLQFGVLAYVYFVSAVLVSLAQYVVEKND
jgi:hypothetical protein